MPRGEAFVSSTLSSSANRTMATMKFCLRAARPIARLTTTGAQRRCISAYGYEQAKVLAFKDYGEPKDVLTLHGHSISPAHGDLVTLKFLASPINPADINQIQGVYPSKPTFTTGLSTPDPIAVGGNEGVAEIISVGTGVTGFKKGDWVIQKAPGSGTWRTHSQTNTNNLVLIKNKEGISPIQAGTVSINPCTAYRMLQGFSDMKEGDWFIQNAANSGVGRAAIQLGKLWGYKSINIIRKRESGTEELKKELEDMGADIVVTDEEAMEKTFSKQVKEWTNGGKEQVKLGLNCVGGKIVTSMSRVLSEGAHLVTYGGMSKQPVTLPTAQLIFKNISFDGFWVSKWSEQNPNDKIKAVEHVLDLTREGKFKDIPLQPVEWDWNTKKEELVDAVQGTLGGFRSGKGIFVFKNT